MKIGVLTLELHGNYGGNLQAFALMTYLKRLGHEPVFINLKDIHLKNDARSKAKRLIKDGLRGLPLMEKKLNASKYIYQHSKYFIDTYIQPQTHSIKCKDDFSTLANLGFDGFIVGSDQVWRKEYVRSLIYDYFFNFLNGSDKIRISYAASFGVDQWQFDETTTKTIAKLIQQFDLVTVREDSAVKLCADHLKRNAEHVIDPVLLLDKDDYHKIIVKEQASSIQGDCMLYVLDKDEAKSNLIDTILELGKLNGYTVNRQSADKYDTIDKRTYPPVTDWLKGFWDAKFVITDSFHGVAFSILFNKPFIAIGNKERGLARFTSILKLFNLEKRLIFSLADFNDALLNQEIDWKGVNEKLDSYRKFSTDLLKTHLN